MDKKVKKDWKFFGVIVLVFIIAVLVNIGSYTFVSQDDLKLRSESSSIPVLVFTMYTSSFAHYSTYHLYGNILAFAITIILLLFFEMYLIPSIGGSPRSDIFYLFVLIAFTILPLVIAFNSLSLWIVRGVPADADCGGFSGIGMAFFGYLMYSICKTAKTAWIIVLGEYWMKISRRYMLAGLGILLPSISWISDATTLSVGSATAHLTGYVFGFGLYLLMDVYGKEDISPWLPEIFRTYNEGWL